MNAYKRLFNLYSQCKKYAGIVSRRRGSAGVESELRAEAGMWFSAAAIVKEELQDRWILLNADDVHQEGDEEWYGYAWRNINPMHIGDRVGEDSAPCRRRAV